METLEFLQRVLPLEGVYVTTIVNPNEKRQGYIDTIEKLSAILLALDAQGNNTYYAVSSFVSKGSRRKENVRVTKSLFLDIDCGEGKPYPSWKEGLVDLGRFVQEVGLPKPMVVYSGNGLHVYWPLTRELAPTEWQPLADALKLATVTHNLKVDAGLTANTALVLRPVGTHNPKGGREVKLLINAPDSAPEDINQCLSKYVQPVVSAPLTLSPLTQALGQISTTIASVVVSKCAQVAWAVENQDLVDEPFWYALLGIAAYCEDPEATAVAWSEKHPEYDYNETIKKLSQWKAATSGPTTCTKFQEFRVKGCKDCQLKGRITTPARAGVSFATAPVATDAPDPVAYSVELPKPFKRTVDGIKLVVDGTDIDICKFDIYPVSYGKDETLGYEVVRYHWNRPHLGWQELVLRQAYLTEGSREFPNAIADQGIVLYNKVQTERFQFMLRQYMDSLRQFRSTTNLYNTMGWKENHSKFVMGNTIVQKKPDGTVESIPITITTGASRVVNDLYTSKGTVKSWVDFTSLAKAVGLHSHMFALNVGFSAPLYSFTGLKGLTVSLYGPTGGGKTLAQLWIQSIWGDPDKLHYASQYTPGALFARLGLYSSMPMTVDEVTLMDDKDVGEFAYWVSQGRDKARLARNAEEKGIKTWAAPVIVSTNRSLQTKLIAGGGDNEAQMVRILEVNIPPHKMFTRSSDAGRMMYDAITSNYGTVGPEFVKKLMEYSEDDINGMIAEWARVFKVKYRPKFQGTERYWEQAIMLADMAGSLAYKWGLVAFEPTEGTEWALKQIGAIRRTVQESRIDGFDLLAEYVNESAEMSISVLHTGVAKPVLDMNRIPRGELRVRYDLYRKTPGSLYDTGTVMIDKVHFRRWLARKAADYNRTLDDFREANVLLAASGSKLSMGKNTPIKTGQVAVIQINLAHPRLQGILDEADSGADNTHYGQVVSIDSKKSA